MNLEDIQDGECMHDILHTLFDLKELEHDQWFQDKCLNILNSLDIQHIRTDYCNILTNPNYVKVHSPYCKLSLLYSIQVELIHQQVFMDQEVYSKQLKQCSQLA
ncbi:uncharacterized protein LOC111706846 [Eurytemora carolleeae]|uniref:uncharacterized protein LOC111706846 n=1 Tax=Eurytemora carolleeae TaxID=1294199 RepID=UPI000C75F2A7|nr:uncharacterized protein LOC111706846 [Eurytemora carolleeae]|eukprot:XP_023335542.1 uncharacterized protein LOC111706846 [Eurytemora affinis]